MDDGSKNDHSNCPTDKSLDNKLANSVAKPLSAFTNQVGTCVKNENLLNSEPCVNETHSMRVILPVFIENEQKYAQVEYQRQRKIQSSPAKAMRRCSHDSSSPEWQLNVSCMIILFYSL